MNKNAREQLVGVFLTRTGGPERRVKEGIFEVFHA
jgi:hypothetical protein